MVQYCVVPMCKANAFTPGVSFHSFPQDESLKKQWVNKIRRDEKRNVQVSYSMRVCSRHFLPEDIIPSKNGLRRLLRKGAVPSVVPSLFQWTLPRENKKRGNITKFDRSPVPADVPVLEDSKVHGNELVTENDSDNKLKRENVLLKAKIEFLKKRLKDVEKENHLMQKLILSKLHKDIINTSKSKPSDYKDINNPDSYHSLEIGYEKFDLMDCFSDTCGPNFKDVNCSQEKGLTTEPITSSSETVSIQNKQKTIRRSVFVTSDSLSAENIPAVFQRKDALKKEKFSYDSLLQNLSLIEKPNALWGITPYSNVIICARWNEDYICEKRIVINISLIARVFFNELEVNLSQLVNITCLDDLSNLLRKIESYKIT